MTLEEMTRANEVFVTPDDIAPILGVDAQSIRTEAGRDVCRLGFHVIRMGNRTMIPRIPFLQYIGAEVKA